MYLEMKGIKGCSFFKVAYWRPGGLLKYTNCACMMTEKKGCRGGSIMLATTKEIDKVRKIQFCFLFFQKNIIQNQWVL